MSQKNSGPMVAREEQMNALRETTAEDVMLFIEEKGINKIACHCGGTTFNLQVMPNERPMITLMPIVNDENYAMWYFTIICPNCGVVKLLSVENVAAWKIARTTRVGSDE